MLSFLLHDVENAVSFKVIGKCVACAASAWFGLEWIKSTVWSDLPNYFTLGCTFNLVVILLWFAFDISAWSSVITGLYLCITAVKCGDMSNSISVKANLISALYAHLIKHTNWGITLISDGFPCNQTLQSPLLFTRTLLFCSYYLVPLIPNCLT